MRAATGGIARTMGSVAAFPPIGYPLLLCWQRGWLPAPAGDVTVRLSDDRILYCARADRTQRTMSLGLYEPAETRLVASLLRPGDVFVDVGAHIGWFTTVGARQVGASGAVIACEPYPPNTRALRKNLALNNAQNVRVVEQALGSHDGVLSLAMATDSGSVTALGWAEEARFAVPMATLDHIAADLPEIALLKVDVEGWEIRVLRGATETLSRTRNVVVELNGPALTAAGSSGEEVTELLRGAGFTTFEPIGQIGLRRLVRSREVTNVLARR